MTGSLRTETFLADSLKRFGLKYFLHKAITTSFMNFTHEFSVNNYLKYSIDCMTTFVFECLFKIQSSFVANWLIFFLSCSTDIFWFLGQLKGGFIFGGVSYYFKAKLNKNVYNKWPYTTYTVLQYAAWFVFPWVKISSTLWNLHIPKWLHLLFVFIFVKPLLCYEHLHCMDDKNIQDKIYMFNLNCFSDYTNDALACSALPV